MELKRAFVSLPKLLMGEILLVVVIAVAAFSASKLLYKEQGHRLTMAVVMPEENGPEKWLMNILSEMESVKSMCEFVYTEEDEALEMVKNGNAYGAILLPDNFVNGILNGTNTPAEIVLPSASSLEKALLEELTKAGAYALASGQAGIYALSDYFWQKNQPDAVATLERDLNEKYIRFTLQRERMFDHRKISATGKLDTGQYYMASAAVLFLLLSTLSLGGILRGEGKAMEDKLVIVGVTRGKTLFIRFLSAFCTMLIISLPLVAAGLLLGLQYKLIHLFLLIAAEATASAFGIFVYSVVKSDLAAVLSLFAASLGMVFLAGGFIPQVFLPQILTKLAIVNPAYAMIQSLGGLFLQDSMASYGFLCIAWGAIFYIAALFVSSKSKGSAGERGGA